MNKTAVTIVTIIATMSQGCTFRTLHVECIPDIPVDLNHSISLYSPSNIRYLDKSTVAIPTEELKRISETSLEVRKENIRLKYGVRKKNEIIKSCREQVDFANSKNAKFVEWWW